MGLNHYMRYRLYTVLVLSTVTGSEKVSWLRRTVSRRLRFIIGLIFLGYLVFVHSKPLTHFRIYFILYTSCSVSIATSFRKLPLFAACRSLRAQYFPLTRTTVRVAVRLTQVPLHLVALRSPSNDLDGNSSSFWHTGRNELFYAI
jgi:hypothetical protein